MYEIPTFLHTYWSMNVYIVWMYASYIYVFYVGILAS